MRRDVWDAAAIRRRLTELADDDPFNQQFGANAHQYKLGAPLSEAEVAVFEHRYGIRLPASYREFITTVGDGGAGPYYGLHPTDRVNRDDDREIVGLLATPFPLTEYWNPGSEETDSDAWIDDDQYFDSRLTAGSISICEFGCGAHFRLVVAGPRAGQVWFDDRSSDGGLTPCADFKDWYLAWLDNPQGVTVTV